jgi:hypothetical protein
MSLVEFISTYPAFTVVFIILVVIALVVEVILQDR